MESLFFEIIGIIGSVCLAFCALPQAIKSIKEKNSNGVSIWLLILWGIGEVCLLIYAIPLMSVPIFLNTISNLVFLGIIGYYKKYFK
jgi:MtN3 and saliva related transmembrane protein